MDVSVRQQIVAQLSMRLLEDRYASGGRLPSTRELARRLRVHRNTVRAVFRTLARRGLVEVRAGSGAYVRGETPARRAGRLGSGNVRDPDLRGWLAAARKRGRTRRWAREQALRWAREVGSRRVTVTGPSSGVRALREAELQEALPGHRVVSADPERLDGPPHRREPGLVVCGPSLRDELDRRLPCWQEIVCLRPASGRTERRLLERLRAGGVVLVLSACGPLVERVRALRAALRGREVAFRCCAIDDPRARAWLRVADCVMADRLALEHRDGSAAPLPSDVVRLRLLARSGLRDLAAYLGGGPPVA